MDKDSTEADTPSH